MDDPESNVLSGVSADPDFETKCEMIRVPQEIWPALKSSLKAQGNFVVAWLQEVCKAYPGRNLLELQQSKPRLFPSLLQTSERSKSIQDYFVLHSNGDISVRNLAQVNDHLREGLRETQLASFRACRFQQGFASEGMLCNEPPIPLRVLDFLETRDLLKLSLVSKSTHQAAHVLFKREEAVAGRVRPIPLPCSTAHPHAKSRAQILRGIRIGSLMHGRPEAIPFRQGTPCLLNFNTAHYARHETLSWSYCGWNHFPTTWLNFQLCLEAQAFKIGARHFGLGNCEILICVFEAPELQALQKKLSGWPTTQMGPHDNETCTFLEILLLVERAISEGETVLWWAWHHFPHA